MFHKNISFYRKYLKSRTENYIYLLPVDVIPPERLKDKPEKLLTEFILSAPTVVAVVRKLNDDAFLDLYSLDGRGGNCFIASAYPFSIDDFFVKNADVYYFEFNDKVFACVGLYDSNYLYIYELKGLFSDFVKVLIYHKESNINAISPAWDKLKQLRFGFSDSQHSIDSLFNADAGVNDRRGKDV